MISDSLNPDCSDSGVLTYKSKNGYGQILKLTITPEEYDNLIYWTVILWINKRKGGYSYLKQTGMDGLSGLLWAKRCIADFIEKKRRPWKDSALNDLMG